MKRVLMFCFCLLIASCSNAIPPIKSTSTSVKLSATITSTSEPSETPQPYINITPLPSATPWLLSSDLSIEEHPLAKRPEIEPLILYPLDGLTQEEMLNKHMVEFQKSLRPESYYSICGCTLWDMQGKDKLEIASRSGTISPEGTLPVEVTRNGNVIFSTSIKPPATTSDIRVLTVYDDHWVLEVAKEKKIEGNQDVDSFFSGEVFIDGKSVNERYGYEESYGFQTINGRPFYFYKSNDKIGISYDELIMPLNYDGVPHYGCCSAGAFNPRMAQNVIGFFAWRGEQWYYVEIGVFNIPNS